MKKKKLWVRLLAALLAVAVLLTGLMVWKNKKQRLRLQPGPKALIRQP